MHGVPHSQDYHASFITIEVTTRHSQSHRPTNTNMPHSLSYTCHCLLEVQWHTVYHVFLENCQCLNFVSHKPSEFSHLYVGIFSRPLPLGHKREAVSFLSGSGPEWTYLLPRPMDTDDLWPSSRSPRLPHYCRPLPVASSPGGDRQTQLSLTAKQPFSCLWMEFVMLWLAASFGQRALMPVGMLFKYLTSNLLY